MTTEQIIKGLEEKLYITKQSALKANTKALDTIAENEALKAALKTIHDMCFVECDKEFNVKAAFELCVKTLKGKQ